MKTKHVYSAWESKTPYRLRLALTESVFPFFRVGNSPLFVVDPFCTLIASECRKAEYTDCILF